MTIAAALGRHHEPTRVETVGEDAGKEAEDAERQELAEDENADRDRRSGQLEHEPRHRDVLHPRSRDRDRLADEEQPVLRCRRLANVRWFRRGTLRSRTGLDERAQRLDRVVDRCQRLAVERAQPGDEATQCASSARAGGRAPPLPSARCLRAGRRLRRRLQGAGRGPRARAGRYAWTSPPGDALPRGGSRTPAPGYERADGDEQRHLSPVTPSGCTSRRSSRASWKSTGRSVFATASGSVETVLAGNSLTRLTKLSAPPVVGYPACA